MEYQPYNPSPRETALNIARQTFIYNGYDDYGRRSNEPEDKFTTEEWVRRAEMILAFLDGDEVTE